MNKIEYTVTDRALIIDGRSVEIPRFVLDAKRETSEYRSSSDLPNSGVIINGHLYSPKNQKWKNLPLMMKNESLRVQAEVKRNNYWPVHSIAICMGLVTFLLFMLYNMLKS